MDVAPQCLCLFFLAYFAFWSMIVIGGPEPTEKELEESRKANRYRSSSWHSSHDESEDEKDDTALWVAIDMMDNGDFFE